MVGRRFQGRRGLCGGLWLLVGLLLLCSQIIGASLAVLSPLAADPSPSVQSRLVTSSLPTSASDLAARVAAPQSIEAGFGAPWGATLSTRLRATIFRFDVADIDALLAPSTSADLDPLASSLSGSDDGGSRGEAEEAIAKQLLEPSPVIFRMTFLRDVAWHRLLARIRKNLRAGIESEILTDAEFDGIWPPFVEQMNALDDRGVREGDRLYFLLEAESVRVLYFSAEADVLLDFVQTGDAQARGTRGAFFSEGSEFREGLIRSLREAIEEREN